jgi:hypothetical protein
MDNQKFEIILKRLLELSEEDKLNWKTTAGPEKYLLALNDSSITIDFIDYIGDLCITFQFKNEKGETVEAVDVNKSEKEIFHKARTLHDLARRKALNSDKTIDRILEQLNPDSIAA